MPNRAQGRGRPYIGPRVDFRVPEEVAEEVERQANELGLPVDAVYRDRLIAGLEAARVSETVSA